MFEAPDFPPPNRQPRPVWPWWVGGIAAALVVVLVAAWFFTRGDGPSTEPGASAPPSQPATSEPIETPEPSGGVDVDPAPTGCIAGAGLDAATFLLAQERAPHTANGAVEATAAMVRFFYQTPAPSAEDQATFQGEAIASTSPVDVVSAFEIPIGEDVAPAGTPLRISTANGAWFLDSYSNERAVVTVAYFWVVEGAVVSSIVQPITFELAWEDGWRLVGIRETANDGAALLGDVGTPFTGGC